MELARRADPVTGAPAQPCAAAPRTGRHRRRARTHRSHTTPEPRSRNWPTPQRRLKITDNALIPADGARGGPQVPFAGLCRHQDHPAPRVTTPSRARGPL